MDLYLCAEDWSQLLFLSVQGVWGLLGPSHISGMYINDIVTETFRWQYVGLQRQTGQSMTQSTGMLTIWN